MVFPATDATEIGDYRNDQKNQIEAGYRLIRIHHPRINQSCERQEYESEERDEQAVVSTLKIIR